MAAKPRVHEIASELGIDSKAALQKLKEMGEFVKSPSSTIQPAVARRLRVALETGFIPPRASSAPRKAEPSPLPARKPKPPRPPVFRPSSPSSDHPEDIAAHQRRRVIQRSEPDWSRFGFSEKERDTWTRAGVPEDMAHIAAMCRDSMKRSESPARLFPANLRKPIVDDPFESQMVIEALLIGEDTIRVQERLAARLAVPPPAAGVELLRVLGAAASVAATGLHGQCSAFAAIDWSPANLPKVAEAALDVLRAIVPHLRTLVDFESQVDEYRSERTVSPLFAAFARAHGVFHVGDDLDALAETVLDHRASFQTALDAITIAETALAAREFSHLHSEAAQSLIGSRVVSLSPDSLLPAPDGILFVDGAPSRLVFWTSTPTGTRCFSLTNDEVSSMTPHWATALGARIERWEPDGYRRYTSTVLPILDALVTARELALRHGSRKVSGDRIERSGGAEIKAVVVSYRPMYPALSSDEPSRPGVKLDHRVRVRSHSRNQFYPSTKEHKVIQIESYEKGPQGAPLLLCDHVAVY